jgi:hypothetical protein
MILYIIYLIIHITLYYLLLLLLLLLLCYIIIKDQLAESPQYPEVVGDRKIVRFLRGFIIIIIIIIIIVF